MRGRRQRRVLHGRRVGFKLRPHARDLIETLLPHLRVPLPQPLPLAQAQAQAQDALLSGSSASSQALKELNGGQAPISACSCSQLCSS